LGDSRGQSDAPADLCVDVSSCQTHMQDEGGTGQTSIRGTVGKVLTVLGPIDADSCGVTLPHEHLLIDLSVRFETPHTTTEKARAYEPVSLDNLGWIRRHPMSNVDNLQLTDEQLAKRELALFQEWGGATIVDMSNIGFARDPLALARISRATGVNVVMGSGYMIEATWPQGMSPNEDEMTERIVRDFLEGVDATGIRPGIIGEVGADWPLTDGERRSLRAAARAQKRVGAAINVHIGNSPESPFQALDILGQAGADISRVAISHCESRIFDYAVLRQLASLGCYVEYDSFGFEGWYQRRMVLSEDDPVRCDMPNDAQRINTLMRLADDGLLSRILISHDVCMKFMLRSFGGGGYLHILEDVVPLMRAKGMTEEMIWTIVVENPRRLLTIE